MRTAVRHNRGVALIMALTVVVILTAVTVDFQYNTRVDLHQAAGGRDQLRAHYLARSALSFARLILYLQKTVDQMLKQYKVNMDLRLWEMIPIDSDLARALTGGVFEGSGAAQELIKRSLISQGMPEDKIPENLSVEMLTGMSFGTSQGFGDFEGRFSADITDEDRKININNPKDQRLMVTALESLLAPEKYDPIFENPDRRGDYCTRQDLISSIIDWVDPDNQMRGMDSGMEDSRYDQLDDPYKSKNHKFDSLAELQLVHCVDDRVWGLFRDALTIYPVDRVNIATAEVQVIQGLIRQYARPGELLDDIRLAGITDRLMTFKGTMGGLFSPREFIQFLRAEEKLDLDWDGLQKAIGTKSRFFTITALGEVNGTSAVITAVMDVDDNLYYYRED